MTSTLPPSQLTSCREFITTERSVLLKAPPQLYQERLTKNVRRHFEKPTPQIIWRELVCAILSSQQKSGKGSSIEKLRQREETTLHWAQKQGDKLEARLAKLYQKFGIHFSKNKAKFIAASWLRLDTAGGWPVLNAVIEMLATTTPNLEKERTAADVVQALFPGVGPKQARNFLQMLGITQWVVPIDSRMRAVLKDLGFPDLPVQLQQPKVYQMSEDLIQEICRELPDLNILPCEFDALAFLKRERI